MSVTEEVTATLRAQEHGHQPICCFAWSNSGKAGLSAAETAPTVKSSRNGEPAIAFLVGGGTSHERTENKHDDLRKRSEHVDRH